MERRIQTVISTLETLLKETLNSAALYEEKEHNATNDLDRQSAYGMRLWCEGRATAYNNAINELKEEFGEGGENDENVL